MAVPVQKRLLTIDEFERLWGDGVFPPEARLELIHGEIVEMTPIGDRHFLCVMFLGDLLADLKPKGIASVQGPLRFRGQTSIPQPDAVVFRRRADFKQRPPRGRDALLVVEVADSTLAYDRNTKIPLYAANGIPEAWLVDLSSDTIFVYRRPSADGYQDVRAYRRGDSISPLAFPEARFSVDEILG
ncbi:MAG TPA: Uma2 family endonuclease [Thermoanaerobaculia bacterium]|jgi:Uma2 family endonuclease